MITRKITNNEKYSFQTGCNVCLLIDVTYLCCGLDDKNKVQNGLLEPFRFFGSIFFPSIISMFNIIFEALNKNVM